MGASNLLTKLIEPIKRFWRKAEHLFSAVLGLNLTINTLSTKKENLCLVDHLFALTILLGNKSYTASKPVYFPLNGTASVGWAAELSLLCRCLTTYSAIDSCSERQCDGVRRHLPQCTNNTCHHLRKFQCSEISCNNFSSVFWTMFCIVLTFEFNLDICLSCMFR